MVNLDNLDPRVVSQVWCVCFGCLGISKALDDRGWRTGERPAMHVRLLFGQVFKSALLRTCLSCVEGVTLEGLTFFLFIPEIQTARGPREPLMAIEG